MQLDENILLPAEFTAATRGKRHFLDEAILPSTALEERGLTVIAFSDILGWTEMMKRDKQAALAIRARNHAIHVKVAALGPAT